MGREDDVLEIGGSGEFEDANAASVERLNQKAGQKVKLFVFQAFIN